MAATAISAEALSKQYRLGLRLPYGTLRDALTQLWAPRRRESGAGARASDDGAWFWALDRLSFEIAEGEVVGVIGRNGSGKSTLLKILSRITEPTSGRARVRGRVGSLLEVGTGFHPELSGRENVFVNGAILGMKRRDIAARFDEIVAFAGVESFVDTPVKFYSSGMQLRLAFSVAAHLEPEILLVDEVLAVGDLGFQAKCLGKMDDVSRKGRTVLFVSHQMNQIRRLCTRCLWLDGGRLVGEGAASEIVADYERSFMRTAATAPASGAGADFLSWSLGSGDAPDHVLTTFDRVRVRFTLRVNQPVHHGQHGLALYDRNASVVWSASTDGLQLEPGLHEIVYDLPSLPLRPGPYRWHVSLFEANRLVNNLDCVPEMEVRTPPLGHHLDEYAGVLNMPYEISITPLRAPGVPVAR